MRNGIVIPCYNEASRLCFESFKTFLNRQKDYMICFVNDGSTDNTLELLNQFRKGREHSVLVYDMPENGGKAEAVRIGIRYMLDQTTVQTIGFMDADLSTGFDDYKNLVSELTGSEGILQMTFGSRRAEGVEGIERSGFRKLMSWVIRFMILAILRLPIRDTQCGAKVFSTEAADYCFKQNFVTKWLFDVELFIRMKKKYSPPMVMNKVKEIPLTSWVDVEGSKITLQDSMRIPSQLVKIASSYILTPGIGRNIRAATLAIGLFLQFFRP